MIIADTDSIIRSKKFLDGLYRLMEKHIDGFKKEEEDEGTGFKEGFDDGVKLYFKMIELLN